MSTTTRKKPIDLSKCKVGQRVRLRNGEVATLTKICDPKLRGYPFFTSDGESHITDGRVYETRKSEYDIIATLPKKAGKNPPKWVEKEARGLMKALGPQDATADKAAIRRVIKLLKGLLKP